MSTKVPPIFVAHGSHRQALDEAHGTELRRWAKDLPRPRGILVLSSLWHAELPTRGSTAARPGRPSRGSTHDRDEGRGSFVYNAPGAPELAYELHSLVTLDRAPERGWDRGVVGPLRHMYPEANVPVLQLSLVTGASPRRLFGLGRKLGVLAGRGFLLMGSGAITYNTQEMDARADAEPAPFARAFDAWVANLLADSEMEDLLAWRSKGPEARRALPAADHLEPLFVVAGAASIYDHAVGFPIRGFEHGTISLRCVQFGR